MGLVGPRRPARRVCPLPALARSAPRRPVLKRFAWLVFALTLASTAHASGVALRWGSCEGFANRSFACDRSTGSELLVASFDPPSGIGQLVGVEAILSIAAADGRVPSWWQMFEAGTCRRSSIQAAFEVSDQMECDDPWNGQANGAVARYQAGANGIDLWLVGAVPPSAVQAVQSGRTYAAFKLIINHQKSNGPSACTGCDVPVCIRLEAIKLVQPSRILRPGTGDPASEAVYKEVTNGISGMGGASQVATWQGGTANCGAGAAKTSTWGELKNRFRTK